MSSDTLPFETAPELVTEICDELPTDEHVEEQARARAEQYSGLDPDYIISRSPRSIAAACVYIESRGADCNPTQAETARAAGISPVAIRQTRDDISETLPESHPCQQVRR
jgi:transcription initiation factor TFIIIB Brf1 subunit/transcription initiation factor TFIIB